jgi:hypothetical protein
MCHFKISSHNIRMCHLGTIRDWKSHLGDFKVAPRRRHSLDWEGIKGEKTIHLPKLPAQLELCCGN